MKKARNILLYMFPILMGLLSTVVFTYGQGYRSFSSELEQIKNIAKWRIGPFKLYPTFQLRNVGYDNNVYQKQGGESVISDYTAVISPQATVYLIFRNWLLLSFSENPEYAFFLREKGLRSLNNSYSPSFKFLLFHRFVLSAKYQYRKGTKRPSSEFDVPVIMKEKEYNGRLFYETARKTSFGFMGSVRRINYDNITIPGEEINLSRTLNREEKSGHFEFYYRIFSESFFFISGGITGYRFEHSQFYWRNSNSYQVYSGIKFPLLGRLRGTLSLGYKKLVPLSGGKRGFSGLVGNTSIEFKVRRFGFRFQYNRNSHFSFWSNSIFFSEDRYGSRISFYPTHFLRIDYNLTYKKINYPETNLINIPGGDDKEIKRKDTHQIHSAGFVFKIVRNMGVGLTVNFWERASNYYSANRQKWFIGGYLTHEF